MKRYAFVIYRSWAYDIFKNIYQWSKQQKNFVIDTFITIPNPEFSVRNIPSDVTIFQVDPKDNVQMEEILSKRNIKIAFFYGWSWIIKDPLLSNILCLGLHPSKLPEFRGGSPLQHQIIAGKTNTYLSLFQTASGIDSGDIYLQSPLSLRGDIQDIFTNMGAVGTEMTKKFIIDDVQGKAIFHPQKNLDRFPPLKRRKPEESEIHIQNLGQTSYISLYNLVRSLTDPYPNAYIAFGSVKMRISKIKKIKKLPKDGIVIHDLAQLPDLNQKNLYLRLKDSFARIERYGIENR